MVKKEKNSTELDPLKSTFVGDEDPSEKERKHKS